MAEKDEKKELIKATDKVDALDLPDGGGGVLVESPVEGAEIVAEPVNLGVRKYVHAAFLILGVLTAYLSSKIFGTIWNYLAEWAFAVRAIPQLVSYPEEQRETFTLVIGAVLGMGGVLQAYRKEKVRGFADEVARELGKVSWPNREMVVNGTLVVIIASAMATVYVAILDRFWGFISALVYGA